MISAGLAEIEANMKDDAADLGVGAAIVIQFCATLGAGISLTAWYLGWALFKKGLAWLHLQELSPSRP